ncbi:MAG: hypothetical protein ACOC56_02730 [Atribacterota bacterium]
MIINQAKVSKALWRFEKRFLNKYNLSSYYSRRKPAIFFGCCREEDVENIKRHNNLKIIIWAGSDAMRMASGKFKFYRDIIRNKEIKHIVISHYIEEDLRRVGLKGFRIPISPSNFTKFEVVPCGNNIYIYAGSKQKLKLYGMDIAHKVMNKVKDINFIVCYSKGKYSYSYNEMPNIYNKCFMGLRLTRHDGLPNTVIEMGLMGRKCIWNGELPNSISWKNEKDIVENIYQLKDDIGKTNKDVSNKMKSYLKIGNTWLDTSFYEKSKKD